MMMMEEREKEEEEEEGEDGPGNPGNPSAQASNHDAINRDRRKTTTRAASEGKRAGIRALSLSESNIQYLRPSRNNNWESQTRPSGSACRKERERETRPRWSDEWINGLLCSSSEPSREEASRTKCVIIEFSSRPVQHMRNLGLQ